MKRLFILSVFFCCSSAFAQPFTKIGGVGRQTSFTVSNTMDNSTRWTTATTASGATVAFGIGGLEIFTSSTAGGNGRANYKMQNSYTPFDGNIDFSSVVDVELEGTNYQTFFGAGAATCAAAGLTMTDKHIGFEFQRSAGVTTVYASCGDGSTQTHTSVSGFSAGTDQLYQWVKDGTAAVRFYIDGTLVTTITTNIPAGSNLNGFMTVVCTNRNTASQTIISVDAMSWEKTGNN